MAGETRTRAGGAEATVLVSTGAVTLEALLHVPEGARGVVLCVHAGDRHSPGHRYVAQAFGDIGLATLALDLLSDEEAQHEDTGRWRFDIGLLAARLLSATDWLAVSPDAARIQGLPVGYFGASTGAAAALVAAAQRPHVVGAVVSRGGRPDLAASELSGVRAPTLLIVGDNDHPAVDLNEAALAQLECEKRMELIAVAAELSEEPDTLDRVAQLARDWFELHLTQRAPAAR